MSTLNRHLDPWEKTNPDEEGLFARLQEMGAADLGEGWNCWIGGSQERISVLVWHSVETTPFRSSGRMDEVLRDFSAWIERRREQARAGRPGAAEVVKRPTRAKSLSALTVIRDLEDACPRCRCALQEVEAVEEGSDERFRYARCPHCEFGGPLP